MSKKDLMVIIGSVILFAILVALILFEMKNPQGGTMLLQNLFA